MKYQVYEYDLVCDTYYGKKYYHAHDVVETDLIVELEEDFTDKEVAKKIGTRKRIKRDPTEVGGVVPFRDSKGLPLFEIRPFQKKKETYE